MGLDMYLQGRVYYMHGKTKKREGYRCNEETYDLGYWRKHPNLHGYIVQNFAGGKDDCQEIDLSNDSMTELIKAVANDALPETSGFFFGTSDGSEKEETLDILNKAVKWMNKIVKGEIRSISYRASW